jgi:hypothetical protein
MTNVRKFMRKVHRLSGVLAVVNLFVLISFTGYTLYFNNIQYSNSAEAAYNSSNNRYEDVLTSPHHIAQYDYLYENTASTTTESFFELIVSNTQGVLPRDVLQMVEITDTYPVSSNGTPQNGAQTNNLTSSAHFSGGSMVVRFGPQSNCIPRVGQGGCQNSTIVPNRKGRITIKVGLKLDASTTPTNIAGSGRFYFGSTSLSPVGWQIQTIYNRTNNVLSPSVAPNINFKGNNGQGGVYVNQNYSVVVSNLQAVNGALLNSSNATCNTVRNNQTFTATGVSNGTCIITISQPATGQLAGGTVTVNDGGSPRGITGNYTYSGSNSNFDPSNNSASIIDIGFNSDRTLYEVNFNTRGFTNGDGGIHTNFYFNTEPGTTTNKTYSNTSPYRLPVSSRPGGATSLCIIVARPDNTVVAGTENCVDLPSATATNNRVPLAPEDISSLFFSCASSSQGSKTLCKFTLPQDRLLPDNFSVGVGGADSVKCRLFGNEALCENAPTPDTSGINNIFAYFGNQAFNTGETVRVSSGSSTADPGNGNLPTVGDGNGTGANNGGSGSGSSPNITDEDGVTTVTLNRNSQDPDVTEDDIEDTSQDPIKSPNSSDNDPTNPDVVPKIESKPVSLLPNPNQLISTGGLTIFVISGVASIIILSVFGVSRYRNNLNLKTTNNPQNKT